MAIFGINFPPKIIHLKTAKSHPWLPPKDIARNCWRFSLGVLLSRESGQHWELGSRGPFYDPEEASGGSGSPQGNAPNVLARASVQLPPAVRGGHRGVHTSGKGEYWMGDDTCMNCKGKHCAKKRSERFCDWSISF